MSTSKPWYKSKIIWFNIISALLEFIQSMFELHILPPGIILLIVNAINIILRRSFTTKVLQQSAPNIPEIKS